jgi:methionyl-tRNA formyltransferase
MAMEEGLDTGPVLLERTLPIGLLDNAQTLGQQLSQLTADLLVEALPAIAAVGPGPREQRLAQLQVRPQSDDGLTYARLLTKADLELDWQASALTLHRHVMGLYPGALTHWRGQRLKVLATEPLVERLQDQLSADVRPWLGRFQEKAAPGTVLAIAAGLGLVVATGGCPLLLRSAQLEGRSACSGQALLQQLQANPGDQFGG